MIDLLTIFVFVFYCIAYRFFYGSSIGSQPHQRALQSGRLDGLSKITSGPPLSVTPPECIIPHNTSCICENFPGIRMVSQVKVYEDTHKETTCRLEKNVFTGAGSINNAEVTLNTTLSGDQGKNAFVFIALIEGQEHVLKMEKDSRKIREFKYSQKIAESFTRAELLENNIVPMSYVSYSNEPESQSILVMDKMYCDGNLGNTYKRIGNQKVVEKMKNETAKPEEFIHKYLKQMTKAMIKIQQIDWTEYPKEYRIYFDWKPENFVIKSLEEYTTMYLMDFGVLGTLEEIQSDKKEGKQHAGMGLGKKTNSFTALSHRLREPGTLDPDLAEYEDIVTFLRSSIWSWYDLCYILTQKMWWYEDSKRHCNVVNSLYTKMTAGTYVPVEHSDFGDFNGANSIWNIYEQVLVNYEEENDNTEKLDKTWNWLQGELNSVVFINWFERWGEAAFPGTLSFD